MADVITRFKLETTQYDSKLRDAAKGLKEFTHQAQLGGKGFTDFSQKAVESARALGNTASGATNTKEKVRDLVGAFNEAARAYNSLSEAQQQHDFGKNLAASLETLKGRITEAKQELYGLGDAMSKSGGGGLFAGLGDKMSGALQVFGGNLMTKGAGMLAGLASEMGDMVKQGVELAKQGEGIRIAFERLGRGDILDGLRQATHGTVTDIELMKAAVKFNDFKLPLDELGTMLAFAQQKAKDTGQSVDYMVDSIVTGLGRKSLMILDNLGLSATEVKDKMAETGDMTKAVGAIIREQMAKAGDYVETAADRATQANVKLENAMSELGTAMRETFGFSGWDDMATSIKTELVGAITFTIETVNEAKQAFMDLLSLKDRLFGSISSQVKPKPVDNNPNRYVETVDSQGNVVKGIHYDANNPNGVNVTAQAQGVVIVGNANRKKSGGGGKGGGATNTETFATDSIAYQEKLVQELTKKWREAGAAVRDDYAKQLGEAKQTLSEMQGGFSTEKLQPIQDLAGRVDNRPGTGLTQGAELTLPAKLEIQSPVEQWKEQITSLQEAMSSAWSTDAITAYQSEIDALQKKIDKFTGKTDGESMAKDWQSAANAIGQVGSAMQQIEDPAAKVMGIVAQAIATIALTYAKSLEGTFTPWDWIAGAASGLATMISTISAIKSATAGSYAEGGIIPGNHYSGDQQWAQVNAGELILNRSQQNSIAAQLQDTERGGYTPSHISGEQIYIALNRYTRRTGKGELVTWR